MSQASKRVEELLDRWMASLELHARYRKLDDAAYVHAENWPPHQRPTAWVIDLARKRLLELRAQLTQRKDDAAFCESLELMSFLTSLLGSEHIERFVPLATGKAPDTAASGTVVQPKVRSAKPRPASGASGTHRQATAPKPAATHKPAAGPRPRPPEAAAGRPEARTARDTVASPADARTRQVLADAVRLLNWGREWPALAGLIAQMADRPAEKDVWPILRAHRAEILAKTRRPPP